MTWYAAHIIEYFKYKEGSTPVYHVHENVVLIQANSTAEAFEEAERIGREEYGQPDDSLTLNDRPALAIFGGIRKLVECQNTVSVDIERGDAELIPGHGMEVTYSTLEVEGDEALQALIKGDSVTVWYEEIRRHTNDDNV